jgi:hypothetical protein
VKTITVWLIYSAGRESMRTTKSRPNLSWDEIAWTVKLSVPAPWGRIAGEVEITLPEGPPPEIKVTEISVPYAAGKET